MATPTKPATTPEVPTTNRYGLFTPPTDKFVIGTVDGGDSHAIEVSAQYNPKELSMQAAAKWAPTNGNGKKASGSSQALAWSGTDPQTMTVELLFDGVEENVSVRPLIDALIALTEPREMKSTDLWMRRPPLCVAIWGTDPKKFRCIVQTVGTKITVFSKHGQPLRATCTVSLMEANVLTMYSGDDHGIDHAGDVDKREFAIRNDSRLKATFDLE
jgi:Contractile injection system tube protein